MTDIIFKNMRGGLADDALEGFAKELGLDVDQWKSDFASDAIAKEVQTDLAAAKGSGQVRGTPSIFVNGQKYGGQRSLEGFKPVIEAEIKKADALMEKGVSIDKVYEKLCKGGS